MNHNSSFYPLILPFFSPPPPHPYFPLPQLILTLFSLQPLSQLSPFSSHPLLSSTPQLTFTLILTSPHYYSFIPFSPPPHPNLSLFSNFPNPAFTPFSILPYSTLYPLPLPHCHLHPFRILFCKSALNVAKFCFIL